ncbi:MAG: 3-hydroxyacyl-CoA dehydrogenase family protein [Bacteroidota bacterium]|nr:3-hydroxyacyl-CoA dehydrogenase family protein [Bacteroidota bacterium]
MRKQIKSEKIKVKKRPTAKHKLQTENSKPVELKQLVCLLGNEALVKEYSAAFQEKGIAVQELKNLASLKTSAKKITAAFELTLESNGQKKKNLQAFDETLPEHVPIISSSLTETILSQSHLLKHKHRFIGIAAFPTLLAHPLVELAPSIHTSKEIADVVTALFESIKKETAMVQDGVGMVMPRILCQIINEALFTVQNDVATPKEIDDAMKLGTNYPHGPIAWGEMIGFANVVAVLDALFQSHHEERYKVAPVLRQMAIAGIFWKKEA